MRQSRFQFYHDANFDRKSCDIDMNLKRIDTKKISKWTELEKKNALEFIEGAQVRFELWKDSLIDDLKGNP